MADLQKFYADIRRCMKHERAMQSAYDGLKTARAAINLFISYSRGLDPLNESLAEYWFKKYIETAPYPEKEPSQEHVDWLADALSLLDGSLENDRDFPHEDWEEIRLLVDSDAQDLPLETISSIMSVMVERGVL